MFAQYDKGECECTKQNGAAVGPMTLAPLVGLDRDGFDFARSMPPLMDPLVRVSVMRAGVVSIILVVYGLDRQLLYCDIVSDSCYFRDPKVILHYLDLDRVSLSRPLFDLFLSLCIFKYCSYF